MQKHVIHLFLVLCCGSLVGQKVGASLPVGTVIPSIACDANPYQTYALYLPSHISPKQNWPIIFVFDPGARGPLAVETVRAAAEKYGYIVAASNNSHNGPLGGFAEAAQAMWRDTQMKLPVDEHRRYTSGMSGGARVATQIALACKDCMAGVIANAATFMGQSAPPPDMKFAYFAAVGNADFNFPEFVALRKKLEEVHARYKIHVFEGEHGWAPPEVWDEALNWMDLQAMGSGTLPRDATRIQKSVDERMVRAKQLAADGDVLESAREYQSIVRDFASLTDVASAREQLTALTKDKAFKNAEKEEAAQVLRQAQLTADISSQIAAIPTGLDAVAFNELHGQMSELKKKADAAAKKNDRDSLVYRRTRQQVVAEAFEDGQAAFDLKKYDQALVDFEIAAAGARHPEYSQFQRARTYALKGDKKGLIATLKLALDLGFDDASALEDDEFRAYRESPEFQAILATVKAKNVRTK